MKRVLLYTTMILCLIDNAYGSESNIRVAILGESMEHGHASTVGIYAGDDIFYGGVSLSHIKSSQVIQYNNRKTIYPVYLFFGLKAPWKFAPYIEAGFDLGDTIINDLYDHEENSVDLVDYYYSGGFMFSATDKVSLLLYAKKYNFKFKENFSSPTIKSRPHSYGGGARIRF